MLSLALPKGSLEEQTMRLLTEADLTPHRTSDRDYRVTIDDARIGEVRILRPQEIPIYVEKGYFDLGISGWDWVQETGSDVVSVMDLSYNRYMVGRPVRVVLAVANDSPVQRGQDIPPAAASPPSIPISPGSTSTAWASRWRSIAPTERRKRRCPTSPTPWWT